MKAPSCRFCGSAGVVKAGWRYNRNGKKQRWLCKSCSRRFTLDDGFLGLWYGGKAVTKAVDLYHSGLSARGTASYMQRHERKRPSPASIWRWIQRFAERVASFMAKLVPKLSNAWHADDGWDWEVMDAETRFWLAVNLTEGWKRTIEQAKTVLRFAREQAKDRPAKLVTDGFLAYWRASNWVLRWPRCKHWPTDWRDGRGPRNLVERKIQTTRMRVKTMRGLRRTRTGQGWLEGFRIHYNFVRTHVGLKKTPAEAAGLRIKLGRNRWLGLISLSVT